MQISDFLMARGMRRPEADRIASAFARVLGYTRALKALAQFLDANWSAGEIISLLTYDTPAWRTSPEQILAAERILSTFVLSAKAARAAVTVHSVFGLFPTEDLVTGLERFASRGCTPDELARIARENPEAFYEAEEAPPPAEPPDPPPTETECTPSPDEEEESEPPAEKTDDSMNADGMKKLIRETLERAKRAFSEEDWPFAALSAAADVWSVVRFWISRESRERFLAALLLSPDLQALLRLPREVIFIRMYVVRTHLQADFVETPEILLYEFEKFTDVEWRYRINVAQQALRRAKKSPERWLAKESSIRLLLVESRDAFLERLRRRADAWPRRPRSPLTLA